MLLLVARLVAPKLASFHFQVKRGMGEKSNILRGGLRRYFQFDLFATLRNPNSLGSLGIFGYALLVYCITFSYLEYPFRVGHWRADDEAAQCDVAAWLGKHHGLGNPEKVRSHLSSEFLMIKVKKTRTT